MKPISFTIKKNLLDLQHSENLSRGTTLISIALGGFISIWLSISNKDVLVALVTASIFAVIFLSAGLIKLSNCKNIKDEIKSLQENGFS